jgi:Subtilase family
MSLLRGKWAIVFALSTLYAQEPEVRTGQVQTSKATVLKSGPSNTAAGVGLVDSGKSLRFVQQSPTIPNGKTAADVKAKWYQVVSPKGSLAWVRADAIAASIVQPPPAPSSGGIAEASQKCEANLAACTPDGCSKPDSTHAAMNRQKRHFASGDPNNRDNQITVLLGAGAPGGKWIVRLHGVAATSGNFHAWIARDDSDQSAFDAAPADNTHTISSLAAGRGTIVVGAYSAHDAGRPLYFGSGAGPTRDGRPKPDISAPGVNVAAANARQPGALILSGTSMAVPATSGAIALLLAEANDKGVSLSASDIRNLVLSTAVPLPAADPRYGAGRLSASAVIQQFLAAHS